MHLMRESWTDARLDDLNQKVDRGFERVDERFERLEAKIDAKFDALYRVMIQAGLGLMAIMIGGFATLLSAQLWA
ncbi:MAG: hypothetical protein AB7T48_02620 [Solirubrobacterales bacterium]